MADSDPRSEERETEAKAQALFEALKRGGRPRVILLVDNYDSFTFNLYQYLGELGAEVKVVRNDAMSVDEALALKPERIVISPGPGTPDEAGISLELIRRSPVPLLGVCLGHQALGQTFGGQVVRAPKLMHGKTSEIRHDGKTIFAGLPDVFTATRYHSLVVAPESVPECLEVSAWTDGGVVMGLRHRERPLEGVQFHPESILTTAGKDLLRNFLGLGAKVSIKRHLAKVARAERLTEDEAAQAMGSIMDGEATPAQIGALLGAMAARGETEDEVVGFARAMRARAVPLTSKGAVDTCGTGGDGAGTFNISTVASFVVAACGVPVAKHGNRSASGTCGSADVLEALGVRIDAPAATVQARARRGGLDLPLRPAVPRLDPARGGPAQGDGRAHRLQPARPAHEPRAPGGAGGGRAEGRSSRRSSRAACSGWGRSGRGWSTGAASTSSPSPAPRRWPSSTAGRSGRSRSSRRTRGSPRPPSRRCAGETRRRTRPSPGRCSREPRGRSATWCC